MLHIKQGFALVAGLLLLGILRVIPLAAQTPTDACFSDPGTGVEIVTLPDGSQRVDPATLRTYDRACMSPRDNRINLDLGVTEVAIYCDDTGIAIWDIDSLSRGVFQFKIAYLDLAQLPAAPEQNILIYEQNGFALYKLTNGQLQVNTPPDWQGKSFSYAWDGCLVQQREATAR